MPSWIKAVLNFIYTLLGIAKADNVFLKKRSD
jgi:hypothetical protein